MPKAVKCDIFLYVNDTCLVCQQKVINKIENQLNKNFCDISDWFVDNKLSMHFGEDKKKSGFFYSKSRRKNIKKLYIKYGDIQMKQHSKVILRSLLDETMSGEAITLNIVSKINNKLKFLYCKNSFLTPALRRLLRKALIQSNFDYARSAWYLNLTNKLKHRIQTNQNKCMRFCLQLDKLKNISHEKFDCLSVIDYP